MAQISTVIGAKCAPLGKILCSTCPLPHFPNHTFSSRVSHPIRVISTDRSRYLRIFHGAHRRVMRKMDAAWSFLSILSESQRKPFSGNKPSNSWDQLFSFRVLPAFSGSFLQDQDPAQWPLVADVSKKALAVRYRLLPYLYTLFYEAHVYGQTVIRPLHHEFKHEEAAYDIQTQFLWGMYYLKALPNSHPESLSRKRIERISVRNYR